MTRGDRRDRADAAGRRRPASCRSRTRSSSAIGAYGYCYFAGDEAGRRRREHARRARAAAAAGGDAGRRARRPGGRAVQPDRRPAAAASTWAWPRSASSSSASTSCYNATGVTGGFNGRDAEPFSLFGFSFANDQPGDFDVFGVPVRPARAAVVPRAGARAARRSGTRATCSAAGRAARWRRSATARSRPPSWASTCRATAAPRSWSRRCTPGWPACCSRWPSAASCRRASASCYSIDFLVMIVIGGLGSVGGAVVGAVFVTALPQVLLTTTRTACRSWRRPAAAGCSRATPPASSTAPRSSPS